MNNQHTPEPWHWDSDPIKGDPLDRVRFRVTAVGRTITQMYYSSGDPVAEADARRIVACVNACAGIPIGELELSRRGSGLRDVAVVHQSFVYRFEEATTQRDELLEALREIRLLASYERGTEDANIHEIARAAITKVKS